MATVSIWRRTVSLAVIVGMTVLTTVPRGPGPSPASAQETGSEAAREPAATAAPSDAIAGAREHVKAGEYDQAIQVLETELDRSDLDLDRRGETYIVLVETLILFSNDWKNKGEFETAKLWMEKAQNRVVECLGTPGLADLRPPAEMEYPEEGEALFRNVHTSMFGSFQVASLEPPEAAVLLDGTRLEPGPGGMLEARNVRAGDHEVRVEADGYKTRVETITVYPGTAQAPEYILQKNRGFMWYATRGAALATGLVVAAIVGNGSGGGSTPPDLPGPPDPPGAP